MKRRLIVLMGLDGSGKSTQAQLLANWFREHSVRAEVVWMRGESYLTVPLLRIGKALLRAPKGRKRGAALPGSPPRPRPGSGGTRAAAAEARAREASQAMEAKQAYEKYVKSKRSLFRNALVRALWRTLVLFDFFITFRVAFGRLAKNVQVVILDRYVYDSLIDLDTGFGSQGAEVKRLMGSSLLRFFPAPDRVVLLEIDPAHAMRRKDDIPSMDYLEERYKLYSSIARYTKATVIDATRSIEEIRSELLENVGQELGG